jgi:hypothetical protein
VLGAATRGVERHVGIRVLNMRLPLFITSLESLVSLGGISVHLAAVCKIRQENVV